MKKLILPWVLLICINLSAQESIKTEKLFVRVFDLDGKKVGKGHIHSANDSLLILSNSAKLKEISITEIGKIKTKRSGGHNLVIGATSGVLAGAILGSLNPPTETSGGTFTWAGGSSGEEFASGLTVGIISGTIVGGISALFKNSETYSVNGNSEKWSFFVEAVKYTIDKRN